MVVQGPFFTVAQAAEYCGYRSVEHFSELVRSFEVPRCGPKGNRYARSVLDAWMACPDTLRQMETYRRRKPKPVTV